MSAQDSRTKSPSHSDDLSRALDQSTESESAEVVSLDLDIAPNDPLIAWFQSSPSAVDISRLTLASPALDQLRAAGVVMVAPLVSQGELIGLINLGARLSEQEYSSDDRKLLNDLAIQAAPAFRVAQLARQQQIEAAERERIAQELRVARIIQQTLLPRSLPEPDGWFISAHYQPAREVGGDFYDFMHLDDGRLGIVIGDVTDKGVPAALVMATTRTLIRAAAERLVSPGQVLQRVNDLLHPDIPPKMFVTCLYAVLDLDSGHLVFANAGHDVPYRHTGAGVLELRATGMPLGLLPGMNYEEKEALLEPGESVLFYSDGLVEAHNTAREMFGFPRLQRLMGGSIGGAELTPYLLRQLSEFTGPGWEQEDDVTMVVLQRDAASESSEEILATFSVASAPGNERQAMQQLESVVAPLTLSEGKLEKLKTAVAEATMNAMEHGNQYDEDLSVDIVVAATDSEVIVRITDHGGGEDIPVSETPDLEAKLAGTQTPRGWGLFLIQNMVDVMHTSVDETHHTVELIVHLEQGDPNGKSGPETL